MPKGFSTYPRYQQVAHRRRRGRITYNNARNALRGIAHLLQVLRNNGEDTGRQGHVEESMGLGATLLNVLEMLLENLERLILVVLAGDIGAEFAELLELLLRLLCGGLHV